MKGTTSEDREDYEDKSSPSWNLPWYECMLATDSRRRQNGDLSVLQSEVKGLKLGEEELTSKIVHDYDYAQTQEVQKDDEKVIMSKEHVDAIQEQMKEYYNLLDLFESMKYKNEQLEQQLKIQRNSSDKTVKLTLNSKAKDSSQTKTANSDDCKNMELEKQIDSLKAIVVNLREDYERKLTNNRTKLCVKGRKAKNRRQCSMATSSTSKNSSQSSDTQRSDTSFPLLNKIMSDLRFETSEKVDKNIKSKRRPQKKISQYSSCA